MFERGNVLDLFAGIGGMTLAAEAAGLSVAYAVGESAQEAEIYRRNFGEKPYILVGDGTELGVETEFDRMQNVDYVIGCLPLPDQNRTDKPGRFGKRENFDKMGLISSLIRAKSVKGYVFTLPGYPYNIFEALEGIVDPGGYEIKCEVINSGSMTGMPVFDQETYIVAIRREYAGRFDFPTKKSDYTYSVGGLMEDQGIEKGMVVDSAEICFQPNADIYNHARNKELREQAVYVADRYIRYNKEYPSFLKQNGIVRGITVRELARTKFFPDEFSFEGADRWAVYKAICNSVNVLAASQIIKRLCMAVEGSVQSVRRAGEEAGKPQRKITVEAGQNKKDAEQKEKRESIESKGNTENTGNTEMVVSVERKDAEEGRQRMFLSYCQKDADIADLIENRLMRLIGDKYYISRDIRDVSYKKSFKKFMDSIRDHAYVLMIISDRYLKSVNCMYEMTEVFRDRNYEEKLLFFVLSEEDKKYFNTSVEGQIAADIYSMEGRAQYILYW